MNESLMTNAFPDSGQPMAGRVGEIAGGRAQDDDALPLFRPEALSAAADTGFGKPIAIRPLSWTLLTGVLATMAVALVCFLFTSTYTRKETATGVVRSIGGNVRIAVLAPGIVKNVLVADGQRVRAGDALVTLDTPHNDVDGRPIDRLTLDNLDRELANLNERLRALDRAAGVEQRGTPAQFAALKGELAAAAAQERSAAERLALARDALAKLEPVAAKGFISGETMRQRKEEIIVLAQSVAEARGTQARLDGQLNELGTSVALRPTSLVKERGQLLDLIAQTRRERDGLAGQRGFTVTAPAAGVVNTVQVSRGQPVNPQNTLMTISTPGSAVSAELFVPSRAIGFLEPGQRVRVRYDALPYQRFGMAEGTVTAISSTVLRPQEVEAAIKVDEPVYRVVISLNRDTLTAYGRDYHIRPGFALRADIVLDRRTFADWLLDPILALRGHL